MTWNPKDIFSLVQPVFKIWELSGFPVYNLNSVTNSEHRNFVIGNFKISFVMIIYVVSNFVLYLYFYGVTYTLRSYVKFIQVTSITVQNLGMIITSYTKRLQVLLLLSKILKIEKLLLDSAQARLKYADIFKYYLKIVTPKYLLISVVCLFNVVYFYDGDKMGLVVGLYFYSGWFTDLNFELLAVLFLILINSLYILLIEEMTKMGQIRLGEMKKIYLLLQDSSRTFHKAMQEMVFLKLVPDFVCSISSIYYGLFETMANDGFTFRGVTNLTGSALGIPSVIISNLCLVYFFEEISKQVNFIFFGING
ncbi:hypothetical protein Zmor_002446 [Zophobas morio]|uniref:Gustatory receptor n=1 Tax=Zophobas morio TaxID=2755281 RepID=A0AA38J577_9CUCU|nr:hypothetical protein Zmor_002446 [Zophobas morio]